ncbi:MAG: carbon storage regulator [Planctomycetes bacterium]|nr:carbon storage regulator [Planctomycetota bacterium]
MLVLTRKQNEKIRIGEQITITVLRMKGKAVRLGIEAPSDVNVLRGELVFELADEMPSDQEDMAVAASHSSQKSRSPSDQKSRRHGLEIGQVAAPRWPIEKQPVKKNNEQAKSNPLRGLASGPLAEMVSARSQ